MINKYYDFFNLNYVIHHLEKDYYGVKKDSYTIPKNYSKKSHLHKSDINPNSL